ncbi:helix-turn-helix domain-containing protein [Enterococcus sp. DIV1444a]|uniref:helix-turn-helix domain-containing protein n=1 Tax=Enterococcus sp. DIV1444a TaxID=2774679 RepID=UPI003F6848B4
MIFLKENFLKQKRIEKNLTLEQVGNFVGVGKSTVRKWETGMIENMGRDKIIALSKVLDVSPLEILGIPETEETPFVVPTNIMNIYKQLTTENQEAVFRYAQKKLTEQNYF